MDKLLRMTLSVIVVSILISCNLLVQSTVPRAANSPTLLNLTKADDIFSHLGLLDEDVIPPREKPAYGAYKAFLNQQLK